MRELLRSFAILILAAGPLSAGALGQLASRLNRGLPGLSPQNLYVPSAPGEIGLPLTPVAAAALGLPPSAAPYPAAWSPVKAAVLLERAQQAGLAAASIPERPAISPENYARRLLADLNAVLMDIPADMLRDMPLERLHDLAGVVMEQAGPVGTLSQRSHPGSVLLAQRRAELIKAHLVPAVNWHQPYPNILDGHEMPRYTRDVPSSARFMTAPYPVLRHFLSDERLEKVMAGTMTNAVLPYVQRTRGVWHDYFELLTGVFLTLPGVPADQVGVREDRTSFVDIKIPASLPLLELEPGRIFLIPMPGMAEGWIKQLYFRWIGGDRGVLSYHDQLPRLEQNGGPGPFLHIPVEIVGTSPAR